MIFAFLLVNSPPPLETSKKSLWIPALLFIAVGALIALTMPNLMPVKFQNRYPGLASAWAGLIVVAGVVVLWLPVKSLRQSVLTLMGLSIATATAAHLIVMPLLMNSFDIKPLALKLGEWERQGIPLAHMNKYHGQYHFIGRLKNPMPIVGQLRPDLAVWMSKHPNGRVVTYYNVLPLAAKPLYTRRFRGKHVAVWDVKTILANPGIAGRK